MSWVHEGMAVLIVASLVSCGGNVGGKPSEAPGGSDFDQLYKVVHYTINEGSCFAEGPDYEWAEPYFRLSADGEGGIGYRLCRSAIDCDENALDNMSFPTPVNNGWANEEAGFGCCDEGTCGVFTLANTLTFDNLANALIERTQCTNDYGSMTDPDDCEDSMALAPTCGADVSGCDHRTVIDGEPMDDPDPEEVF